MEYQTARFGELARRHQFRVWMSGFIACIDFALVGISFKLTSNIYLDGADGPSPLLVSTWALLVYGISAVKYGVYTSPHLQRFQLSLELVVRAMVRTVIIVSIAIFLLSAANEFSRVVFVAGFLVAVIAILIHRTLAFPFYQRVYASFGPHTLVIADDVQAPALPGAIVIHAAHEGLRPNGSDPTSLDRLATRVEGFERIVVACPLERREIWAFALQGAHIQGEILADELRDLRALRVKMADGYASLVVTTANLSIVDRITKRAFDLVVALVALVLLSPICILTALCIKLDDGGPVFFHQQRVGRSNRFFKLLKFRSMKASPSKSVGRDTTSKNDDRITRVGRFIRRTSIDEIPQFINVLRGDMSIVGPRPHALGSRAGQSLFWEVDQKYWHRHLVKPGITGLAQVRGFRGPTDDENDLMLRLNSDLEYVNHWTLWRDLVIVARTFLVFTHPNAF